MNVEARFGIVAVAEERAVGFEWILVRSGEGVFEAGRSVLELLAPFLFRNDRQVEVDYL